MSDAVRTLERRHEILELFAEASGRAAPDIQRRALLWRTGARSTIKGAPDMRRTHAACGRPGCIEPTGPRVRVGGQDYCEPCAAILVAFLHRPPNPWR